MNRTSLLRGNNARAYMNYLKAIGVPFEMICSNYTVLFKSEFLERKFVHSMQGNRAFACFAKLKSDLDKKQKPDIDMNDISYFVHDFKLNEYVGNVVNIDLKSAYATVLYRDGYISKGTFEYICKGTKQERLTSVGMLASKKQHFTFDKGSITGVKEIISPYSNYFFYCVKRTAEIMADLKEIAGNSYLFTWVDGIYIRPSTNTVEQMQKYIIQLNYNYSTEQLRNFEVKIKPKFVTVSFEKYSKGKWIEKPFNLPHANTEFKRLIVDAILSRKLKVNK